MSRLETMLRGTPYAAYLYGYPHKTAYRPLAPALPLGPLWERERCESLFLYLHIPFCEMRCGFCNLFTAAGPRDDVVEGYLAALEREARRVKEALGSVRFARCAVGGGTPTLLSPHGLTRVLDVAERVMGAPLPAIPLSVECSPETVEADRLQVLHARGVDRVSIGVQSFVEAEVAAVKRPQKPADVERALSLLKAQGFATLNIDLIYGMSGQTEESLLSSLRQALRFSPEELYLYPLYVRPLTLLGKKGESWDDMRLRLYRTGRDFLLSEGYTQVSMRMFRAAHAPADSGPAYRCQEDGMVGLGCGARSYTDALHYSSEYAVGARAVRDIITDYVQRPEDSFGRVFYGIRLDAEEKRRRFVILSLLGGALVHSEYQRRFGAPVLEDLPELSALGEHGLAEEREGALVLTPAGVERSDAVGPWLQSERVRSLMREYQWR
jgi:oxygen-independent coproporphyrinogen-3 oxidase